MIDTITKYRYRGNGSKPKPLVFSDLKQIVQERDVEFVDLKFTDLPGLLQHYTLHVSMLNEDLFIEGTGFDGSSIRGFQAIHESDMLLKPDPDTAFIDPFLDEPTLSLFCNIKDPTTSAIYSRDPRYVAQKAENFLRATGVADASYWGPEAEFYIFDDVRFDQTPQRGFYQVDSKEGFWNSGKEENPNLGHKPRYKGGYFPAPPIDSQANLRSKMVTVMRSIGVPAEIQHHEVGTAGQAEINMHYGTLVQTADNLMKFKYVVKNVARRYGKTATFMPKPLFMDNGTGMHTHQSLWKSGKNAFFESGGYADISSACRWYIGGLLHHAASLLAFCAPTTNSYRRLVPGYEAPIHLIYSQRNRSACIRIPMYSPSPAAKRLELRCPDPACNPYLAFAACLMAGIDGILNQIEPPDPIDTDLYEMDEAETAQIKSTPGSLEEAIKALEGDYAYLLQGDVFTQDLIETWIDFKKKSEIDPIKLRPHPWEFALYYDI